MVFLDAHCECVQNWLEPLLAPIVESRSTVVTPIIDVIDYNDMQVRTAQINARGSFDLSLSFTWDPIPQRVLDALQNDRTAGIETPAMVFNNTSMQSTNTNIAHLCIKSKNLSIDISIYLSIGWRSLCHRSSIFLQFGRIR